MDWSHGYNVSLGYTYGYYRETSPSWLDLSARLSGQRAPGGGRRYLELGCGQGVNLVLHAAAHPDIEFLGVDFNPIHVTHARGLAAAAGLRNIRFEEADFLDLAQNWPEDFGHFHYTILHGIYSWVGAGLRRAIVDCLDHALIPGGLVYVSYNTQPGWTSTLPMQYLLLRYGETESLKPVVAIDKGLAFLSRMNAAGTAMFKSLPQLSARLEKTAKQDRAYLVQEYLHDDAWHPLWFGQVAGEMAHAKLRPIGTATLPEILLPQALPEAMRALVEEADDPVFRQEIIDCCVNQAFRRDLFMRGENRGWPVRQAREWEETALVALPGAPSDDFKFATSFGEIIGNVDICRPMMEALVQGPRSLAQIRSDPRLAGRAFGDLLQTLIFLVHSSRVAMVNRSADPKVAARLNRTLARAVAEGAPYGFAAAATSGLALPMKDVDFLMLDALADMGRPDAGALGPALLTRLAALNRTLAKDGQPLTGDAARELAGATASAFLTGAFANLKRLGGW